MSLPFPIFISYTYIYIYWSKSETFCLEKCYFPVNINSIHQYVVIWGFFSQWTKEVTLLSKSDIFNLLFFVVFNAILMFYIVNQINYVLFQFTFFFKNIFITSTDIISTLNGMNISVCFYFSTNRSCLMFSVSLPPSGHSARPTMQSPAVY